MTGFCVVLFPFITSLIYAQIPCMLSSIVGQITGCLRHLWKSARSKSEICWYISIRIFSVAKWTGHHRVTGNCVLSVSIGQLSLLSNYFKTLCVPVEALTLQGHWLPNTGWAEVKNAWSKLTLAWVLWPTQRNRTQSSGGKKKSGRGARSSATDLA